MNDVFLLKESREKSNLPVVFYHTTFEENASLILTQHQIIGRVKKCGQKGLYGDIMICEAK